MYLFVVAQPGACSTDFGWRDQKQAMLHLQIFFNGELQLENIRIWTLKALVAHGANLTLT